MEAPTSLRRQALLFVASFLSSVYRHRWPKEGDRRNFILSVGLLAPFGGGQSGYHDLGQESSN